MKLLAAFFFGLVVGIAITLIRIIKSK